MWRRIIEDLDRWKDSPGRQPLMLVGPRQCGKTHILKEFGDTRFRAKAYFDFERDGGLAEIFDGDLDAVRILDRLSARARVTIDSDVLVILDEIQGCDRAVTALKYLAEEAPRIPVVCAASLPVSGPSPKPVGKVDILHMRPMDFREWLAANGRELLWDEMVRDVDGLPAILSRDLEELYRDYLFVGGMPRAVSAWVSTRSEERVREVQTGILNWFIADFMRHVPGNDADKVFRVWESVPSQICGGAGRFAFSRVRKGGRARELEGALWWLVSAGLVTKVDAVGAPGVPLRMDRDTSAFRVYPCDVGLMGAMAGTTLDLYLDDTIPATDGFRDAAAECFVLGELLSSFRRAPVYWRGGNSEVDFLVEHRSRAYPVEVKAGREVKAKGLAGYIDGHSPEAAFLLSLDPAKGGRVRSLPLYAASLIRAELDAMRGGSRSRSPDTILIIASFASVIPNIAGIVGSDPRTLLPWSSRSVSTLIGGSTE